MSFDVLQDKIKAKKNPTVAGLDARVEYVPPHILKKYTALHGETLQAAALAAPPYRWGRRGGAWTFPRRCGGRGR